MTRHGTIDVFSPRQVARRTAGIGNVARITVVAHVARVAPMSTATPSDSVVRRRHLPYASLARCAAACVLPPVSQAVTHWYTSSPQRLAACIRHPFKLPTHFCYAVTIACLRVSTVNSAVPVMRASCWCCTGTACSSSTLSTQVQAAEYFLSSVSLAHNAP